MARKPKPHVVPENEAPEEEVRSDSVRVLAPPQQAALQHRRSPRAVVAASGTPSVADIMRMEAAKRTSTVRTRGVTQQIRAGRAGSGSPHESSVSDAGDGEAAGTEEDASIHGDSDDGDDSDDDEAAAAEADEADDDGDKSHQGKKRRARDPPVDRIGIVQVSKTPVEVPAPEREHADWDAWNGYLMAYMAAASQNIVVKYTLNTQAKNKKLAALVAPKPPLPDEVCEFFQRTYHCTHSWKISKRGTGRRPKRFVRGIDCPFSFRIQWEERKGGGVSTWRLVVFPGCMWHNHRLTPEVLATYPKKRLFVANPDNLQRVREWDDLGVPREQIHDMFLDRGDNLFKDDVVNFVSEDRATKSRADDDDAVAKLLYNYSLLNSDGLVTIDETDEGKAGVLSITTKHMREMFERFGELLLIDCTHKTNK